MSKFSTGALVPLLIVGLWGTSFSICQGFMMENSPTQFLPETCCTDICHQMCEIIAVDSPVSPPKADSLVAEISASASLSVTPGNFVESRSSGRAYSFDFEPQPAGTAGEVYLRNAVFLI